MQRVTQRTKGAGGERAGSAGREARVGGAGCWGTPSARSHPDDGSEAGRRDMVETLDIGSGEEAGTGAERGRETVATGGARRSREPGAFHWLGSAKVSGGGGGCHRGRERARGNGRANRSPDEGGTASRSQWEGDSARGGGRRCREEPMGRVEAGAGPWANGNPSQGAAGIAVGARTRRLSRGAPTAARPSASGGPGGACGEEGGGEGPEGGEAGARLTTCQILGDELGHAPPRAGHPPRPAPPEGPAEWPAGPARLLHSSGRRWGRGGRPGHLPPRLLGLPPLPGACPRRSLPGLGPTAAAPRLETCVSRAGAPG